MHTLARTSVVVDCSLTTRVLHSCCPCYSHHKVPSRSTHSLTNPVESSPTAALLAWRLTTSHHVSVVWNQVTEANAAYGVSMQSQQLGNTRFRPQVVASTVQEAFQKAEQKPFDFVIVAPQSLKQLNSLHKLIKPYIHKHTCVIVDSSLYGVNLESLVAQTLPNTAVYSLTCTADVRRISPTEFAHFGPSTTTYVGRCVPQEGFQSREADQLIRSFTVGLQSAGLDASFSSNVLQYQWDRAIPALSFQPLTILLESPVPAEFVQDMLARPLFYGIMAELIQIAAAQNVQVNRNVDEFEKTALEEFLKDAPKHAAAPYTHAPLLFYNYFNKFEFPVDVFLLQPILLADDLGIKTPYLESLFTIMTQYARFNNTSGDEKSSIFFTRRGARGSNSGNSSSSDLPLATSSPVALKKPTTPALNGHAQGHAATPDSNGSPALDVNEYAGIASYTESPQQKQQTQQLKDKEEALRQREAALAARERALQNGEANMQHHQQHMHHPSQSGPSGPGNHFPGGPGPYGHGPGPQYGGPGPNGPGGPGPGPGPNPYMNGGHPNMSMPALNSLPTSPSFVQKFEAGAHGAPFLQSRAASYSQLRDYNTGVDGPYKTGGQPMQHNKSMDDGQSVMGDTSMMSGDVDMMSMTAKRNKNRSRHSYSRGQSSQTHLPNVKSMSQNGDFRGHDTPFDTGIADYVSAVTYRAPTMTGYPSQEFGPQSRNNSFSYGRTSSMGVGMAGGGMGMHSSVPPGGRRNTNSMPPQQKQPFRPIGPNSNSSSSNVESGSDKSLP
jgi:ketopantoate reductase